MDQTVDLVNVTIDGRAVKVPKGTLIVEAARRAGVAIPIFCYHPKLKPVGACRMCYVQIEKAPGLATACTTTVGEGMIVHTGSPPVVKAQRGVIELLLINHPLDCPVCDRGGECPLQDNTFSWGGAESRYVEEKRHYVKPVPLSPLVLFDRERCILCYRCVRFQNEIAGDDTLTVLNRGSESEIGLLPGRVFDSPFSGNTIEICPVGALTSAKYRFQARPWDLKSTASICPHCSVGCNIRVDARDDQVKRHLSRENTPVDDGWLCDRGRFGYDFVNSPERVTTPLVRRDGALQPATWPEALTAIREGLGAIARRDARLVGGVVAPTMTNEEIYLFQKLFRAVLGTNNVDHSFGPSVAPSPLGFDAASGSIAGLERAEVILLVGANPTRIQPVLALRIRKAIDRGVRLIAIGSVRIDLENAAARVLRVAPGQEGVAIVLLLRQLVASDGQNAEFVQGRTSGFDGLKESLAGLDAARLAGAAGLATPAIEAVAGMLSGKRLAVLYPRARGADADGALLVAAITNLILATGSLGRDGTGVYPLVDDANTQGAVDMGALPDRLPGQRGLDDTADLGKLWRGQVPTARGLTGVQMLLGGVRALYLAGLDPVRGGGFPGAEAALRGLEFLVVQDSLLTETAMLAHVVLPGLTYAEKDGTFTNLERRVQRLRAAVASPAPIPSQPGWSQAGSPSTSMNASIRQPSPPVTLNSPLRSERHPDWRVIQDVANWLGGRFLYTSVQEVLAEIALAAPIYAGISYQRVGFKGVQWPYPQPDGQGTRVLYADEARTFEFAALPERVRG